MPYASCKNCCHLQAASGCELGLRPDDGQLLCKKYAMTVSFREDVLGHLRREIKAEVNRAVIGIRLREAEEAQAFAG